MTWQVPENDPEEAQRVIRVRRRAASDLQAALVAAECCRGGFERCLLFRPVSMMDAPDLDTLSRMAWHYRRHLPAHLRPGVRLHDPVARELESAHG